jgi:hypothetical protein
LTTHGDPPWKRVHEEALASGAHSYLDPDTGYVVFTELFHRARGTCCGSGCRHCPYDHVAVSKSPSR